MGGNLWGEIYEGKFMRGNLWKFMGGNLWEIYGGKKGLILG